MRRLIIAGLVATFAGIPASAQSPRTEVRTVMRDGMMCREKTQVRKSGRRSYDLKCKEVKRAKGHGRRDRRDDDRDDDDRARRSRECMDANRDNRCDYTTRPTTCTDRDRDGRCDGAINGNRRMKAAPAIQPDGGAALFTLSPLLRRPRGRIWRMSAY